MFIYNNWNGWNQYIVQVSMWGNTQGGSEKQLPCFCVNAERVKLLNLYQSFSVFNKQTHITLKLIYLQKCIYWIWWLWFLILVNYNPFKLCTEVIFQLCRLLLCACAVWPRLHGFQPQLQSIFGPSADALHIGAFGGRCIQQHRDRELRGQQSAITTDFRYPGKQKKH